MSDTPEPTKLQFTSDFYKLTHDWGIHLIISLCIVSCVAFLCLTIKHYNTQRYEVDKINHETHYLRVKLEYDQWHNIHINKEK